MNTRSLTPEERFELVMECRSRGLSDYQWCQEKGINPDTFYNWIARFRKKGYPNIPGPTGRSSAHKAVKQEVVKLDILPDEPMTRNTLPWQSFEPTEFGNAVTGKPCDVAIEICTGSSIIHMSNNIDPQLFSMVLSQLGGLKGSATFLWPPTYISSPAIPT